MSDPRDMPHDHPWFEPLTKLRYRHIGVRDGTWCAIQRFNYTTATVVALDPVGYSRRYCYEHAEKPRPRSLAGTGGTTPARPWIKCKGASIDLLNPALTC
ncbi:hypothetical protein WKW77_34115 [Variovorax ureilyticus]|uniref:Uncharacterized protein n=1 Tax=Variovorax ureilyticus TaxID=1836198 RepID=A0ABU8VR41_9BURK